MNFKIMLLIFSLIIFSCHYNNYPPRELTVSKVEYHEDTDGYYLRVYTDLESGKVFGTYGNYHVNWEDIITIDNNKIIGDDYSKYFSFAVKIQNRLDSVMDQGKVIYFNDKIFQPVVLTATRITMNTAALPQNLWLLHFNMFFSLYRISQSTVP